ncbi:alpha-1,2-fucosyltransferase [Agrobacterium tumefaciens]|uniref:alpha-1,2-fucosyltransferase n=1 Tax=Agrobacterium tumefaciens TaxID=358 RepID=UPI00287CA496|nr:alpha-1,2-fucosyltransferase [Agrobacterium tumefaciens]MDS7594771.1 alpha-1,2-fucosyltransferase [Agrobacterium tumefaciens]
MSSVVVPLIGGLGNQMFQYAAARAVALRTGSAVRLELSWFGTDPDRQYALEPFAIDAMTMVSEKQAAPKYDLLSRIVRRLPIARRQNGLPVFKETSFRYDSGIEELRSPVFLDGYFQSEKYFSNYRDQIAADFKLRNAPLPPTAAILEQIGNCDAICLHIRRGDYVTNKAANAHHGTCSLEYYKLGLEHVIEGLARPHCFVFSDDPEWARGNFVPKIPVTFVDIHATNQAHEDLRLMAACQRYVIANSSLSWWGAWLGSHSNKKVVAPAQWFQKRDMDTSDLVPSSWIRV